jgi:hypothetical protein
MVVISSLLLFVFWVLISIADVESGASLEQLIFRAYATKKVAKITI